MKKFIIFFLTAFLILGFSLVNAEKSAPKVPAVDAFSLQIAPNSHTYSIVSDTTLKFTVSVASGNVSNAATIQWYVNGSVYGSSNSFSSPSSFKPNFQVAGNYEVYAKVIDGSDVQQTSVIEVTVLENYTVSVLGANTACLGDNVTLTAELGNVEPNNLTAFSFQWKKDGNYIPGANHATYTFVATEDMSGDYVVEVSRPGCALATSHPHRLDVLPKAVVDVEPIWYLCNGSVTVTAAAFPESNGTPYQWMWVGNNDTTITNISSFTTSEEGIYYVKPLYHVTGCNNADSARFEVKALEDFEIQFAQEIINTCNGDQVELTLNVNDSSNVVYTWYENGVIIEGANTSFLRTSPLVTGADTTLYKYVVVANTTDGCFLGTDTMDVIVRPQHQIQLLGDHAICAGADVVINAAFNVLTPSLDNMIWYQNGVAISGQTGTTLTVPGLDPSAEPYVFHVEYYDNATGCHSVSEQILVTVYANPVVNITPETATICLQDDGVTLTANLNDWNAENLTFQWYKDNSEIAGATTLIYTATEPGNYSIKVTQTNTGCTANDAIEVKVNTMPEITISNPGADVICDGGQVLLNTVFEGDGEFSYVWYRNGVQIEGANLSYLNDSPLAVDGDSTIYVYEVMAISNDGCYSNVASETIVVRRNHRIEIFGDHDVCVGPNNITIDAYIDGVTGNSIHFDNITWYQNGAIITNSNPSRTSLIRTYPVAVNFEPYTFQVSYYDPETHCNAMSEPFVVTVHDMPVVNITSSEDVVCEGGEVTLVANLNDYNEDQYTFQWYKNGKSEENKILGATLPTYTTTMPVAAVDSFFVQVIQRNTTCERFAKKEITTIADPVIESITLDVYAICEGRQVTVTATSNAGEGAVYTWYRNGALIEGVTAASFTESPLAVDGDATAYVYSAYVTTPVSGCQSAIVAAEALTVNANPTVTISGDPIVCDETENNVTLTANVIGVLPVTYQWYENDVVIAGENAATFETTKEYREYPYSFSVQVSNEVGCTVMSEPFLVYVNDSIVVNVTATENTICEGGEVTMTAHLNDWNADQIVYQWYKDGVVIPGATDLNYTTTLNDVADYEFSFRATQLTSSCTAIGATTINVVADPVIESITVSEYALCSGGEITVTAHPASVTGTATYTWYRNGELIEGVTAASFTESPLAVDADVTTYVYSAVLTTNVSGCESSIVESTPVTVYGNPRVDIAGDANICETDSVYLAAYVDHISDEVGILSYTWYVDGQRRDNLGYGIDSPNSQFYSEYWPARYEPYRVTVEVTRENGCTTMSEQFLQYVHALPVVNITPSTTDICVGGEVELTANLDDYTTEHMTYQWFTAVDVTDTIPSGPNSFTTVTETIYTNIPGATSQTLLVNPAATTRYGVKVYQTHSECYDIDEVTVNVLPLPTLDDVTLSVNSICDGGQVTITATNSNDDSVFGTPVYTWYRNGVLIEGVTSASFTESPLAVDGDVTTYIYSATVSYSVSGCQSVNYVADTLSVYANPTVTISGDPIVCNAGDNNVTLTANVIGALPVSYQWYENDTPISGEENSVLDLTKPYREYPYSFSVQVSNAVGCTVMSEPFLVYVNDGIVVNVTATENTICEGGEVTMTAHLNDWNADQIVYQWYKDGVVIPGATDLNYTTTLNEVADYEFSFSATQLTSSCTATGATTINVVADPIIESITLDEYAICEGGQVTITATSNAGADAVYTWYRNGDLIEGVTASSFTESPLAVDGDATAYVYSAYVTTPVSGCQSAIVAAEALTVYANPTVTISGDPIVCQDSVVRLVANVNDLIENATITYQWRRFNQDIPGATSRELTTTEDFAFGNPIEYTVVVNAQYDNFIGCRTISEPFNVVIGANPRFELTATDTVVCAGGEVEIAANIANSYVENLEVNWYVNGEYITGAHGLTYTATITENSVFTATIASNECVAVAEPIAITVIDLPTVASVTAYNQDGVTSVCDGGEVEVTAYMVDADGNQYIDSTVQYQWTRNGFVLENVTGPWFRESLMSVDQDTTHITYSVVAISPITGCVSVPTQSNTVTVFRNPIVVINGSHNVCENISNNDPNVNLTVAIDGIVGYDPTTTIRWYKNGVLYETIDPYGISFSELLGVTNQSVEYQVEVIRPNGCSAWSEPFIVDVHPAPVLNITVDQNFVCQGGELTLVGNLNDYNEDNYVYQWYYTNTNVNSYDLIPGATQRTFDVPVHLQSGEYNFMLEVYQRILDGSVLGYGPSCSATDTINIDVLPQPVVDSIVVAGTGNNNSICSGGVVELTAYVSDLPGTITYQWYRNGILIEGASAATIIDNPIANDDDVSTYIYSVVASSQYSGCQTSGDVTSDPVIVYPNPRVAISGDASICEGDSVFLIAYVDNTSDAVGDLTYTWFESGQERDNMSFNLGNQPGSQFYSEYWYPRHEPYVFTVEVTRGNGCTSISEPFNVYVHERPEVDVTATETTVCEGGEVTLTANLADNTTDNITYQWYTINSVERQVEREAGVFTTVVDVITTNIEGATSATYTTTVNGTTQFGVTVFQTNSECTNTDVITINTVPAPVVTGISVAGVNAGNEICEGGQVTLTAAIEGGVQGGEVYTWYRNGVVIPNATTATLVETPASVDGDVTTYTYNVSVAQTASGCSSTLDAATEVTIVVNPNPTVSVVVEGNATICDGGSVTLNANVYPVLPTTTYQWFVDNTPIADATSASYTVDNAVARESAYQYHVVVSQLSGCSVVSEVVPVSVVSDPVVNVTVDNASVCLGGSATFTATIEGGVNNINGLNGYTYAWYSNLNTEDVIGTGSTLNVSATETGTYTYWVVVTSPYGCETIAHYYDFTVVADPTVAVSIANGYPTQVCEGGSTMLTATVTGGLGTYSYQWYKNGNLLPGETNQTIHTDPLFMNAAATYTVNVVMSGVGCEATNSFVAGGIGGIVVDAPEVVISGNANTCPGGTVTLTANVTGGINGDVYQYQWYQNGQPVGANSDVYTTSPLLLGNSYNYRVEVISTVSGCSAISNDVPANVYPEPTVAISGPNPSGISTICEAGSITLNAYVTGGVPGETYTYTWTYRQGANSGQFVTTTSSFDVPATLVANSDPNSPYYFSVSVMSDNYHCDAVSSADQSYIINIISAPQATISVTNSIACEGGDITFTANVTPVGVYNYAWTIDGTTYNSNNAAITLSNLAVGTHTATVVVSSNASSSACTATATATATVVSDPVVTITSDVTTLCAGGTVVLSVDQVVLDPAVSVSNYTYEWRENGVLVPNVIGTTFTQTINAPGVHTYAVRVIANNGLGCASDWSNEIQVTVVEQPVVTISPVGVAMLDICEGGQIEMIANVTNSSAAQGTYTYTWYANNSNTGVTTATYAQTLNAVGAYNFYVVVNANGNSCAPATSNTLTFNVNSDPYWTNVNVFYPEICEGESVELQASVSGGVTDNAGNTVGTIVWNVTDPANNHFTVNGATNSQSVFHTPAVTGTYMYQPTFVGAIGNGCDIDTNVVVPVEVFARPTASFTSGDGVVVCANDPNSFGELVVTINSNYPPFMFTVVGTDGSNNTYHTYNNTYTIYVTPSTSVTYSITSLEDAHCEAINPSSEATVIVSQIELVDDIVATCNDAEHPMATMGVVIYSAAPGVVPTVNVIYNDPNYTAYNAYNVPIDNDGTTSSFTFPTPTVPGDYSITIEIDGCEYDAIVRVLASQYSYGETPIVNQRWDDVLVVNNNPATNGGHTYISYQWYKNGQPIEGATNQFYQEIGGVNGYYSVNLIAKDADGNIYEITTCEELFVAQSLMKVYPVPAQLNEAVTIEVNLTDEQLTGAVLDIYDAKGAVVRHLDVNSNVIVVSGFETQGSYFGRIITGNGEIKTVKFVIVK